jgi:hypothetical protein
MSPDNISVMARLLRLSDLHLGKPEAHQWLDQHKGNLVGTDRGAEKDILRETINALPRLIETSGRRLASQPLLVGGSAEQAEGQLPR